MNHKLIKEKTSNKLENRAKKQGTYSNKYSFIRTNYFKRK